MKKFTALMIALMLFCSCALAEIMTIDETNLTFDLCGMELWDFDEEDEEVVMVFGDEAETVECFVMLFDATDLTLADIEAEQAEEDNIAMGYTTINGIQAFYCAYQEDGENYLEYYIIDNDVLVCFSFWYADDAAGQLTANVMNTLSLVK